ncbi:MAG: ion transporter [Candidatus Latescibacteria bacterium]|nr:ion transporter [Candidatus Latescibacterota bacterium]
MNDRWKHRTHDILERASSGDRVSRAFDLFIMALIVVNVVMVVLETVENLSIEHAGLFRRFEIVSVAIFTVEYLLRLWCCTADPRYGRAIVGRLRFAMSAMALIDLVAILPFYLPMIVVLDLRFVRAVRLFRLFRLLKMGRYVVSLRILADVIRAKKEELYIILFVLLIMLVTTSSLMYFIEHEAQPEAFSSIPAAMWWGVVTLTTVGYGDVYPVTPLGRFLGILIALLGIGMFALPAGILSSGFVDALQHRREQARACPHCGREIDEGT